MKLIILKHIETMALGTILCTETAGKSYGHTRKTQRGCTAQDGVGCMLSPPPVFTTPAACLSGVVYLS